MKDFLKTVLAVVVGLIAVSVISGIFTLAVIGSIALAGKSTPVLPKSGVLKIDLSSDCLAEQSQSLDPISSLKGEQSRTIGIYDACRAVRLAADDPAVKFIYVRADANASSISYLEELRAALADFREKGSKAVITYMESPNIPGMYIGSVSDRIYLTSCDGSNPMFFGLTARLTYFGDALKALGVNVQLIRHGKYKSAGEPFVRSTPSEENLTQYRELLGSLWSTVGGAIAEGRGIGIDRLDRMIDNLELGECADFVKAGLADSLMSRTGLEQKVAELAMESSYGDVDWILLDEYVKVKCAQRKSAHEKIAVIYADGDIVDGRSDEPGKVCGDPFAKTVAQVRADSSVKAVVFRVNSPGGSVLASEKILDEIRQLKAVKPVVASYGGYAASGGYWISNCCDRIFSDATCLTGSIGVFSMIPDVSRTLKEKAHIGVYAVNTHDHSNIFSLTHPLSESEMAYMQRSVEGIYSRFVDIVAGSRSLDPEYVDEIGQGRVWSGVAGVEKGLVDEVGDLSDAVAYAASLIGKDDPEDCGIVSYPGVPDTMKQLMMMFNGLSNPSDRDISAYVDWFKSYRDGKSEVTFARLPFRVEIR